MGRRILLRKESHATLVACLETPTPEGNKQERAHKRVLTRKLRGGLLLLGALFIMLTELVSNIMLYYYRKEHDHHLLQEQQRKKIMP